MRPGVARWQGLADAVAARTPIAALYPLAEEVQVMSSLAGFEALLRGRRVVVHGQPGYAGWGLTEDRAPLARRQRRLTVDELVAGMLILYPRYWHPVTGAPCVVEEVLAALAAAPAPLPPRLPAWLRRRVARASAWVTALGARL
jgi:capsular polysaccharide export protein